MSPIVPPHAAALAGAAVLHLLTSSFLHGIATQWSETHTPVRATPPPQLVQTAKVAHTWMLVLFAHHPALPGSGAVAVVWLVTLAGLGAVTFKVGRSAQHPDRAQLPPRFFGDGNPRPPSAAVSGSRPRPTG